MRDNKIGVKEISVINDDRSIDREQEDKDIIEFQKTGDLKILDRVYRKRIQTIKVWTNKYYHPGLTLSMDDLFCELSLVFVKAASKFDYKRGSFNSCLFIFLLNRIKNLKNSRHAKKRVSKEYSGAIGSMILSLDYNYNSKDGQDISLKDIIASKETNNKEYISKDMSINETLNILSQNNPIVKEFLTKISEGGSLAALLKEYKTRKGELIIDNKQAKQLSRHRCNRIVSDMLKPIVNDDFKLVDYSVMNDSKIQYEIELKKTKESDSIVRALRELRKNKDLYVNAISG